MKQLYQEVHVEPHDSSVERAMKNARSKMMMRHKWPLCNIHSVPYSLASVRYATGDISVFLQCQDCVNNIGQEQVRWL